jgi:hypothetical protein
MLVGITQFAIAGVLIGAVGGSVLLSPVQRPREKAAFLERVAQRVERAQTLAPETRDYLVALVKRHRAADQGKDLRGERAAERLASAITQKSARYVSR